MKDVHSSASIFAPGENCHLVADFSRFAVLIDGAAYFSALADALAQAKRRIMIVGWDFNSLIQLRPDEGEAAPQIGDYLRGLVEANPDLEVKLLIWRNSIFYGSNVDLPISLAPRWSDHPRIEFKLDDRHPWGACHHQKLVCIDHALAFTGGIDLTQARWDTPDHRPEEPLRQKVDGEPYRPVHDVQAMLDGDAARALSDIAADRWRAAGGEDLPPLPRASTTPWPASVVPDLRHHAAAIARTQPVYEDQAEVTEIRCLNERMLQSARRSIYIESQYFAVPEVAEILAWHLGRPDGPEIVLVVNYESSGMVEHYVMANNRDRLFALLRQSDRYGRLRTYHPTACSETECQIKTHSKIMIVDDGLLRIGSSNFNARSLGLDTECDLAIEGNSVEARQTIARVRNALLAEHVGVDPAVFAAQLDRGGSLIAVIEALNTGSRRLTSYPELPMEDTALATGTSLLDPERPIDLKYLWDKLSSPSL